MKKCSSRKQHDNRKESTYEWSTTGGGHSRLRGTMIAYLTKDSEITFVSSSSLYFARRNVQWGRGSHIMVVQQKSLASSRTRRVGGEEKPMKWRWFGSLEAVLGVAIVTAA